MVVRRRIEEEHKVFKVGRSTAIVLPKYFLALLGWENEESLTVMLDLKNNRIIIRR